MSCILGHIFMRCFSVCLYLKIAVHVIDCSAIAVLACANLCTSIGMKLDVSWVTEPGILGKVFVGDKPFSYVPICLPLCSLVYEK